MTLCEVELYSYRTVVATHDFVVDACRSEVGHESVAYDEVVDAPPCILLAGVETITPPRVRTLEGGVEMAEGVCESAS